MKERIEKGGLRKVIQGEGGLERGESEGFLIGLFTAYE